MIPAGLSFKWEVLNRFICHVCSYVHQLIVLKLVVTTLSQNIFTVYPCVLICIYHNAVLNVCWYGFNLSPIFAGYLNWQYDNRTTCGPFYWHRLTLISELKSNYIDYKVWNETTFPFPNGTTVDVREWIRSYELDWVPEDLNLTMEI